ncbi:hypothetical protein [Methanobrevibacter ruminantium]|uniref:hypothetical protein n=1 Tax=Methanobrevibacter ruminantium TaxID=83816 RepID=UPI000662624F|nr:hypothetical protein [Methanobrevibacter ruminantium]
MMRFCEKTQKHKLIKTQKQSCEKTQKHKLIKTQKQSCEKTQKHKITNVKKHNCEKIIANTKKKYLEKTSFLAIKSYHAMNYSGNLANLRLNSCFNTKLSQTSLRRYYNPIMSKNNINII